MPRAEDPFRTVPASRHPFQLLIMVALATAGLAVVSQDAAPGSIADLVAPWAVQLWGWTMLFGGVVAVASAYWPDRILALLMERIALGAIAGACLVYSIGVVDAFRLENGSLNAGVFIGISVAAVLRIRDVNRELGRLQYLIEMNRGV